MRKRFCCFAAAMAALLCGFNAKAASVVPRLTAQELIERYVGDPNSPILSQDAQVQMNRRQAEGYLDGVADSTQGRAWCDAGTIKRGEINSMIVGALRKLPKEQLQAPAAGLVERSLRRLFPCK